MKKENSRTALPFKKQGKKKEFLRLALLDGILIIDPLQNKGGRGIYIEKSKDAIEVIKRKRLLDRYQKNIDDDFYEELKKAI